MKNHLIKLGGVLMISALVLGSCKKGEDDPFLSLKSRDARITGTWELVDYTAEDKGSDGTYTTTFDGNQITDTDPSGVKKTYQYSETITIGKDGTYTVEGMEDASKFSVTGQWWWLNDTKNKTRIAFGDDWDSYEVLRLKNKELVLGYFDQSSSSNQEYSFSAKRTYQKK